MDPRHALGHYGESVAESWLVSKGFRIRDRRYVTRFGEIDLIAEDADTWVFIEVKTRTHAWEPSALDALTPAKQRRIVQSALCYIRHHRLQGEAFRFDVLVLEGGVIDWIPNAFDAPPWATL